MVKRFIVVLMGCSFGLAIFASASSSFGQDVVPPAKPVVGNPAGSVGAKSGEATAQSKPAEVQSPVAKPLVAKPAVAGPASKQDSIKSENLLPASTKFWVSIPNGKELDKRFKSTQFSKLAQDPAIKPFIDSLREQSKDLMKKQNFRLGLELDDLHDIDSGEMCLAGIIRQDAGADAKGSHGVVMLVDVSKSYEAARKLQKKINDELKKNGAVQETNSIQEVDVIKSTIKRKNLRNKQSNYQAIVGKKWMLISDNEEIFRDIFRRLVAKKIAKGETLAGQPAFLAIMKETKLAPHDSQIRWYIDPFGYIQLAQALEDNTRQNREARDDIAAILKKQGLGAARAIGGNIAISTGEHEMLHRTFTYAPRKQTVVNANRMFELFDFSPDEDRPLTPPIWVPEDASGYMSGNWDMTKALNSFGFLYDAFIGEVGSFKRLLSDFRVDPDMQLDIEKLVDLIDNRFTVVSASQRPITGASERVIIGFPIKPKAEPDYIFKSILRATGGEEIKLAGHPVVKVEASSAVDPDLDPGPFDFPDAMDEEEEEPAKQFELFEKRYFVVVKGQLLVANNKDYLKKLLAQKASKLSKSADYIQIKDALEKLTDPDKISWRHFGRIDKMLETNYEMLRRGEMGDSQTVLAKVVNQIFKKQEEESGDDAAVRKQKLDGSKLPADYAKQVAPYFGSMGWVLETEKSGWRITGVVLKKK